ncbi:hypothetical protein BJX66DRAFT_348679 [Aspergillus keveii]|uniref:Rhodopsin domain-containing protein n=1 Tax=Aspergillus keveii TaxID=714993 RepID=A0ABR4FLB6_9EURO
MEPPKAPTLARHAVALLTVSTVLHPLAILSVGLRFLARRKTASVKIDDWLALLALVFGTGLYVTGILICTIGFAGFHAAVLEVYQIERFLLLVYIDNLFYALTLPTIKISILYMYHRLFPVRKFAYALIVVGLIVTGWMVSVVTVQIFTCTPVRGAWIPSAANHCINQTKFYYGNSVSNILTDVGILALPMPLIWQLKMSRRKKIAVTGILLMGGFVCISSIVRLCYLARIDNNDITYSLVAVGNWTSIETPLAIICGCLPTLPVLFRSHRTREPSSNSHGSTPLVSTGDHKGGESIPLDSMDSSRIYVSRQIEHRVQHV